MGRIKGVRKKLSEELGFLVRPCTSATTWNRPELLPHHHPRSAGGESEVFPDRELAINPGQVSGTIPGTPTKDPHSLDAVWVDKSRRDQAQAQASPSSTRAA